MKNERVYDLLILFVIFIFIKKVVAIAVEIKLPTYDDLFEASDFWKKMVKLRTFFEIITFIASFYFLFNYNFNFFIRTIFLIIAIHSILYFLIDERFIYSLINETENNKKVIYILDIYGDSIENLIVAIFAFYALITIFSKPK
jgi:hypothetical protein